MTAHLQHVERRHHATMQKLDSLCERVTRFTGSAASTGEVGAGAFVGGLFEGRLQSGQDPRTGRKPLPFSPSLALGIGTSLVGFFDMTGQHNSHHWSSLGNGLIASWLANKGYSFGQRHRGAA